MSVATEPRYRLIREVARGGGGQVFLASDVATGRHVAVKLPRPEAGRAGADRIVREHAVLARCRHPHLVAALDLVDVARLGGAAPRDLPPSAPALVLEHLAGPSLAEARLPRDRALVAWAHVAHALEALHGHGYVHRDVSPANVVLRGASAESPVDAVLTDLGVAARTGEGEPAGTPDYMAPETLLGLAPRPTADVHGLGCLLYFLLVGRAPWSELAPRAALLERRHGSPEFPAEANVSPALRRVLAALLSPNPSARPAGALAAVALLNRETGAHLPENLGEVAARPGLAPWIGRADVVAAAEAALSDAEVAEPDRPARVVFVSGAVGSGRTRLLEELETRARLRGLAVHRAAPATSDARAVVLLDESSCGDAQAARAGTWFVALPDGAPPPRGASETLVLGPLGEAECAALACSILGLPPGAAPDGAVLRAASGGLPGPLEQWIAACSEAGHLGIEDGRLRIAPGALSGEDATKLVERRAARLTARARALLDLAAIFGRPATTAQLAALLGEGDAGRIAAEVAELLAGGFLRTVSDDPELGPVHEVPAAIADPLARLVPATRLRMLHLAAASVLQQTDPAASGEHADHLEAAGAPQRALPLHVDAGRAFLARGLPMAAARHLRRALALAGESGERGSMLLALARAEALSGDAGAAVRTVGEALLLVTSPAERAEALAFAAESASHAGDPDAAEKACRDARRLFRRVGSPSGRAECANRLGLIAMERGEARKAGAAFRAALAVARREGDRALEARVLNNLGSFARDRGDLDQAALHHAAARDTRRQLGDVRGAAKALNNLAIVHGMSGRLAEAASTLAEAVAAFRECGDRREEGRCLNNRGMVLWQSDRLAEADECFRQAADLYAALDDARFRAYCLRNRGVLALDRGRLAEARDQLGAAASEDASGATAAERAGALGDLADVLRAAGDLEGAAAARKAGRDLAQKPGPVLEILRVAAALDEHLRGTARAAIPREPGDFAEWSEEDRLRWLIEAAQLAEAAGEPVVARRMGCAARSLRVARPGWDALAAAVLAAGSSPAGEAVHALAEAVSRLQPGTHVEWAWRARLRLARGLAAGDRPLAAATQAEGALEELRQLAESLPAGERDRVWAAHGRTAVREELGWLVASPARRYQDVLTPALLDFVRLLNSNLDVERLLPRVVDFALELTGADRGAILLFDESPDAVRVARTLKGDDLPRETFQVPRAIVEKVRETGLPVVISSFADDLSAPRSASIHELGLAAATCVPLAAPAEAGGGLIGALHVDSLVAPSAFGDREVELLKALAAHAAVAIVNARLLARVQAEKATLEHEVERLRSAGLPDSAFGAALGRSPAMRKVFALLERVAASDASVLIEGESGTGKEVVARALHARSRRAAGPFVAVDCGSLPESLIESELFGHRRGAFTGADRDRPGLFEQATGGTIFLDEIAGTSAAVQSKLLRVLQEREVRRIGENVARPVDVRVVAASNRPLADEVAAGRFRADLLYRLDVVHVDLPPLRDRPEDIPLLSRHFLERAAAREERDLRGFEPAALQALVRHDWPGNVRELANVVERAVVMADGPFVRPSDLPGTIAGASPPRETAPVPPGGTDARSGPDPWIAITEGRETFWTAVRDPFARHDLTREEVQSFVSRGLLRTSGSYRGLARLLGLAPDEYKRFMDFLRQNRCHVDFRPYRAARRPS